MVDWIADYWATLDQRPIAPGFYGYFPANTSGPSVLGDLVGSGLGVQGMLWATSPACTELETVLLDWLAQLLDLPQRFRSAGAGGGVIQDSASSATLVATPTAPHPFALVCFRLRPDDDVNAELLARTNRTGRVYLTHTRVAGRYTLRLAVGSPQSAERHIDEPGRCSAASPPTCSAGRAARPGGQQVVRSRRAGLRPAR